MRRGLLVLTAIATALALAPATSSAGEMKDSWLTTKAKMAMVKDDRVKARRVKVETQDGIVTLRGKVATVDEKSAAEEIARGIDGATSVSNALQVVPDDMRPAVDVKDASSRRRSRRASTRTIGSRKPASMCAWTTAW